MRHTGGLWGGHQTGGLQADRVPLCPSDREQIYVGDDNALTLEVSAENRGEGAYEAELHVYPPQQADFTGVVRSQVGGGAGGWGGVRSGESQRNLIPTDASTFWCGPDSQQVVLRLQEGEPDQDGGV